jgi:hypothetical protein
MQGRQGILGTARLADESNTSEQKRGWTWLVVIAFLVGGWLIYEHFGAAKLAPKPTPTIISFEAQRNEGIFSHDLLYKYTGWQDLEDVDITVTVWYDRGAISEIKRVWASWLPLEQKTVNISASSGTPEKHRLYGTAQIGPEKVVIDAYFLHKASGRGDPSGFPVVVFVEKGSVAEAAGIKPGDVLVEYNGVSLITESITNDELGRAIRAAAAKPTVRLQILRNGNTINVQVPGGKRLGVNHSVLR